MLKAYLDWRAGTYNRLTSHKAISAVHSNAPHIIFTKMLGDFQYEAYAMPFNLQGSQNMWQLSIEVHIHHSTNHLHSQAAQP